MSGSEPSVRKLRVGESASERPSSGAAIATGTTVPPTMIATATSGSIRPFICSLIHPPGKLQGHTRRYCSWAFAAAGKLRGHQSSPKQGEEFPVLESRGSLVKNCVAAEQQRDQRPQRGRDVLRWMRERSIGFVVVDGEDRHALRQVLVTPSELQ